MPLRIRDIPEKLNSSISTDKTLPEKVESTRRPLSPGSNLKHKLEFSFAYRIWERLTVLGLKLESDKVGAVRASVHIEACTGS